jgi:hypothetical protein
MNPLQLSIVILLVGGLVGTVLTPSPFRRMTPSSESIDHPAWMCRVFNRTMLILACMLLSFVISTVILGALMNAFSPLEGVLRGIREETDGVKAAAVLLMPLPLMPVLYLLYAKVARSRFAEGRAEDG